MSMDMSINMEEQYDRIYRYCYFRLRSRQAAEDITQETFLRYLEKYRDDRCVAGEQALRYLYTIARNLCVDEYRRRSREQLWEDTSNGELFHKTGKADVMQEALNRENPEEGFLTNLAVRKAVASLGRDEQELLLLRYVNGVPMLTLARLLGISRFAVYRRLAVVTRKFKENLRKEGIE